MQTGSGPEANTPDDNDTFSPRPREAAARLRRLRRVFPENCAGVLDAVPTVLRIRELSPRRRKFQAAAAVNALTDPQREILAKLCQLELERLKLQTQLAQSGYKPQPQGELL